MKEKEATNRRGFIKKSVLGFMGAGFLSRKGFSHPEEAARMVPRMVPGKLFFIYV